MSEFDYNDQSVSYGEAPKTPTMGVVALVLSIAAIFVALIACCCTPILFGLVSLIMSIVALALNIVAGNQMKAMYGESNGFIKVTRFIEIFIIVLMFLGLCGDVVATIINIKNAMDPNSTYNQVMNQLLGN